MGWVVLTLRKTELKRTQSDYQMDLLRISREKRQMAREKHYNQTVVRNDQSADIKALKEQYDAQKNAIKADSSYNYSGLDSDSSVFTTGSSNTDNTSDNYFSMEGLSEDEGSGINDITSTTTNSSTTTTNSSSGATSLTTNQQNALNDAKEDYILATNEIKSYYEDELEMIEEEASEEETFIDQEQTEIEALLEAVSQEMESVGQAISSQIQSSTIKLS